MTWRLLITEPQHETITFGHLVGRRIPAYLPCYPVFRRRGVSRALVKRYVPMFRGYVFADPYDDTQFGMAVSVPGAHRFLTFGECVGVVPEHELARVRSVEEMLREDADRPPSERKYTVGEVVRIIRDLWEGIKAQVEQIDSHGRLVLHGPRLGRIVVAPDQVEPA